MNRVFVAIRSPALFQESNAGLSIIPVLCWCQLCSAPWSSTDVTVSASLAPHTVTYIMAWRGGTTLRGRVLDYPSCCCSWSDNTFMPTSATASGSDDSWLVGFEADQRSFEVPLIRVVVSWTCRNGRTTACNITSTRVYRLTEQQSPTTLHSDTHFTARDRFVSIPDRQVLVLLPAGTRWTSGHSPLHECPVPSS